MSWRVRALASSKRWAISSGVVTWAGAGMGTGYRPQAPGGRGASGRARPGRGTGTAAGLREGIKPPSVVGFVALRGTKTTTNVGAGLGSWGWARELGLGSGGRAPDPGIPGQPISKTLE